jgi:hypothetical protein
MSVLVRTEAFLEGKGTQMGYLLKGQTMPRIHLFDLFVVGYHVVSSEDITRIALRIVVKCILKIAFNILMITQIYTPRIAIAILMLS